MEQVDVEKLIGELELAVDRLRSLYEQYFVGIEKLEPQVPRKDVDRRIHVLRKEQIRNTALRFRFQMVLQRYNTYQTHWQRICREIENGTYKRHLIRAQRRLGSTRPPPRRRSSIPPSVRPEPNPPLPKELSAELAELDRDFAPASAPMSLSDAATGVVPAAPRVPSLPARPRPPVLAPAGAPPTSSPASVAQPPPRPGNLVLKKLQPPGAPAAPTGAAPRPGQAPTPAPAPAPAPAHSSSPVPGRPAAPRPGPPPPPRPHASSRPDAVPAPPPRPMSPSRPDAPVPAMRPIAASRPDAAVPPARPTSPSRPDAAVPAMRPIAASHPDAALVPPLPPMRPTVATRPDGSPLPPRPPAASRPDAGPPPPRPPAASRPDAGPPPPRPPAASRPDSSAADLSEARMRQIYSDFVDARRRQNESTATITYQAVAKTLRESGDKLREKHGKAVDFEVAVKDGKTILKPVLK